MSTTDVPDLLFNLRTEINRIANDDQQHLLEQNITQEDLKKALENLVRQLQKTAPKSKTDKWLSKTDSIVEKLSPVIDAAVGLGSSFSPGPLIWNSIKIVLQISSSKSEVFEVLFDTLIYIADNMPRICSFGTNWPLESRLDNPGHAALAAILTYLTDASKTIQSKRNILTRGFDLSGMREARAKLERTFISADFESIARTFKKQQKVVNKERYEKLVKQLHTSNYESNLSRRRDARLEDTCSWSLNSNTRIGKWYDGTGASRLWITGKPGSGKSTLASYLVDYLPKTISEDEILLYYFCDGSDTATSILKSLLVQVLKTTDRRLYLADLESLQDEVLPKHDDYQFSIQDMKEYLGLVLKSFTKLCIVVDGLDECDAFRSNATKSDFESVKLINTLIEHPHSTTRLLFISRKEPYLAELLAGWDVVELGQDDTTADDLRALASSEAEKVMKEIPLLTQRQDLVSEILVNADGMFIYIRLLFDSLRAAKSAAPVVVEEILADSPRGLDAMYEKYFSTLLQRNAVIPGRIDMAIQVLQWLIVSEAPIGLNRIREIIQIRPGDDDFDRRKSVADIEAELREVLGILVEFQGQAARLVHQSLRDLFRHPRTNSDTNAPYLQRLYVAMSPETASACVLLESCTILCVSSAILSFGQVNKNYPSQRAFLQNIGFEGLYYLKLRNESDYIPPDFYWRMLQLRSPFSALGLPLILYHILLQCSLSASTLASHVYRDLIHGPIRSLRLLFVDIAFALDSFANEALRMSEFSSHSHLLAQSPGHHFEPIYAISAHLVKISWTPNDLHDQINKYTSLPTPGVSTDIVRDTIQSFQFSEYSLHHLLRFSDVIANNSSWKGYFTASLTGRDQALKQKSHPLRALASIYQQKYAIMVRSQQKPDELIGVNREANHYDSSSRWLVIRSLFSIIAFSLPLPLWIIILLGFISVEKHRYHYFYHDPSQPRQMVRSIFFSLLIGRILSKLMETLLFFRRSFSRHSLSQGHSSSSFLLASLIATIFIGVLYGLDILPGHAKANGRDNDSEQNLEANNESRRGTNEDAKKTDVLSWIHTIFHIFLPCEDDFLSQIWIDKNGVRWKTVNRICIDPPTYKIITVIVAELSFMNRAIPFSVAWYEPVPATSTLEAINSIIDIISVSLALDKVFTFIIDPTGLHHALSILTGLSARFEEMRLVFEGARERQLKETKKQWESAMGITKA